MRMIYALLGKVSRGRWKKVHYIEYRRYLAFFAVPFQIPGVYESLLKLKQTGVDITNQHLYEVQCNFYLNHLAYQICLVPTLGRLIYNHGTDANMTIDLGFPFLFSRVI